RLSVFRNDTKFVVVIFTLSDNLIDFIKRSLSVIGMNKRHESCDRCRLLVRLQSEQTPDHLRPNRCTGLDVPLPPANPRRLLGQDRSLFTLAQRFLGLPALRDLANSGQYFVTFAGDDGRLVEVTPVRVGKFILQKSWFI